LLERARIQQAHGDRIVENFWLAVQKLVHGSERGDAKSRSARVAFWHGVSHDLSL